MKDRIYIDLRSNLHCDIDIRITLADDPELDAWKGQRMFYNNEIDNKSCFISKEDYFEYGAEYFVEHRCSNSLVNYRGGSSLGYDLMNKKAKLI